MDELAQAQYEFGSGNSYDTVKAVVTDQAIGQIYQDIYGWAPRVAELAEAQTDFANGISFDAIFSKVQRRRDAVLLILSQYLMERQ